MSVKDKVVKKALESEAFKAELIKDPRAAVSKEIGQQIPADVEIKVVQETAKTFYIVLPDNKLSDETLDAVAGGGCAYHLG